MNISPTAAAPPIRTLILNRAFIEKDNYKLIKLNLCKNVQDGLFLASLHYSNERFTYHPHSHSDPEQGI